MSNSLISLFTWNLRGSTNEELPNIFPFSIAEGEFVKSDILNIYKRILTDVLERTQGISEDAQALLWDNCIASESQDGLVTLLAKAMADKSHLFLVYDKALKVIKKADQFQQSLIEADYKKMGMSSVGVYITFKNYSRTDMVKIYSSLEYCTVASLSKSMNLSKAIQLKFTDLRSSTGVIDSGQVKAQAVKLAEGLSQGKDIMLDAKDMIETAQPDLTATQASMQFIAEKRSFYLGLPSSYITGMTPKGLGDTGEGDGRAIERGLKNYYFSIIKPVIESIFGAKTSFKSEDFRQIAGSLETLKTFELVSDELVSMENKQLIINNLFGLGNEQTAKKS